VTRRSGSARYFGSGSLAAAGSKTVQIPDAWKAAWKYYYDSIWTDHVSLTGPQFESKDINPKDYPFFNGNTAMSENFLWSTYGVGDAGDDWDLAAIPSYNGQATAAFNADTFRILKGSKHPEEAFQVLTYLLGDAAPELLKAYGGFPARTADQPAGIDALQSQFKNKVDWQVAVDGIGNAGLQRESRPRRIGWEVPDEVGQYRRTGHGQGDPGAPGRHAGDLEQGALSPARSSIPRQQEDAWPRSASSRSARPAPIGGAGSGARRWARRPSPGMRPAGA